MDENFYVLRRTRSEIDAFGGEVYVDIDGKNVGIVHQTDLKFKLNIGKHVIKMYKSHTMGTFIGIAEVAIDISDEEKLVAKYSAPLMVNQPGNIQISQYESDEQLDRMTNAVESIVHADFNSQQHKIQQNAEESEKNNRNLIIWIFVVPAIIGFIWFLIEMSIIYD